MSNKVLSLQDDVIYSTHPEFENEYANIRESETLPTTKQSLVITLKKRKIDGALVTEISGFVGKHVDLLKLEEELQKVCRTCASTRKYDIVLMRDVRGRAYVYLRNQGFGVRLADS